MPKYCIQNRLQIAEPSVGSLNWDATDVLKKWQKLNFSELVSTCLVFLQKSLVPAPFIKDTAKYYYKGLHKLSYLLLEIQCLDEKIQYNKKFRPYITSIQWKKFPPEKSHYLRSIQQWYQIGNTIVPKCPIILSMLHIYFLRMTKCH